MNSSHPIHRIALLASGEGTNAEAIAQHFAGRTDIVVALCLSNRTTAGVHERMRRLGIPTRTFPRAEWQEGRAVLRLLETERVDFLALAGFLCIIPEAILRAFEGRIVNVHPSLLPRHGGPGMYGRHVHEAVLRAGETQSGITIHRVTETVDGGEILFQAAVPAYPAATPDHPADTPDSLAQRIHRLEHTHYPRVIEEALKGRFVHSQGF